MYLKNVINLTNMLRVIVVFAGKGYGSNYVTTYYIFYICYHVIKGRTDILVIRSSVG